MREERKCLECGDRIIGRSDKKFCSDACRNAHNNSLNRDSKNLVRNINNRLRKNYRILETLNTREKTRTTKDKLLSMGFDFNYFTQVYTTKAGAVYYYLYDQGYLPLDNDYYLLVKKDS
jgi:predicted nucleic acid-binding Zn ribbon protein